MFMIIKIKLDQYQTNEYAGQLYSVKDGIYFCMLLLLSFTAVVVRLTHTTECDPTE